LALEILNRQFRPCRSLKLLNLHVGEAAATSREAVDWDLSIVTFAADQVIHADWLVQRKCLTLVDENPMLIFPG
jgi:hypothetical protein